MTTPHEIKFALDSKLAKRGLQIVGIHSVAVEDGVCFIGYDIEPGGEVLFFEFEKPEQASRDDMRNFAIWLAWSDVERTVH